MAERRQLPILNQKMAPAAGTVAPPEEDDDRPPWHWSAIGAVLVFTLWLPLAMAGQWVSRQLLLGLVPGGSTSQVGEFLTNASTSAQLSVKVAMVGPPLTSFAFACISGGALVGYFGGKAGRKEATVGGLVAATTAWALTAAGVGLGAAWMLWPPVAVLGSGFALLGGYLGERRRRRA